MTTSTLSVQELNSIFSSDEYSDFVRKFVKNDFSIEKDFNFRESFNGIFAVSEGGHTLGFVPSDISGRAKELVQKKSFKFFIQGNALSYSKYEMVSIQLADIFEKVCKDNHIALSYKENHRIAKETLITLIKDFFL